VERNVAKIQRRQLTKQVLLYLSCSIPSPVRLFPVLYRVLWVKTGIQAFLHPRQRRWGGGGGRGRRGATF
jgi:hypothetical protein